MGRIGDTTENRSDNKLLSTLKKGTMPLVLNVFLHQSKDIGRYFRNSSTVYLSDNGSFQDLARHVYNLYNVQPSRVTFKFNNKDIPLTGVRVKDAADKLGLRSGHSVYAYIA